MGLPHPLHHSGTGVYRPPQAQFPLATLGPLTRRAQGTQGRGIYPTIWANPRVMTWNQWYMRPALEAVTQGHMVRRK